MHCHGKYSAGSLMRYQAVFFDFDGVILDTVDVKTDAFASMFHKYGPEVEQAVVDYHLAHGGVSRFEKFKYYYSELLKKPIVDEELNQLGRQFNKLVLEKVLAAPFIPGALETLKELQEKGVPSFVVSGTPDEEIKFIVQRRKLSDYFLEVHGSPRTKSEIVAELLQRYGYAAEECLFIGDAMTDYDTAVKSNVNFLGIVNKVAASPFPTGTWVAAVVELMAG
jgi:HAD superfamily hydrolase (TIGR01549 family)